jgi:hypothetical protein
MASDYTDTTDTNFKEEPYNIDTGKPLSAAGVRNALHTKEAALPVGTILAMSASSWTNASATFKSKWKVCDGTGGTPDLRGRFLRGGTSSDAATGGANSQTVSVPLPKHKHTFTGNNQTGDFGSNGMELCGGNNSAWGVKANGVFSISSAINGAYQHPGSGGTANLFHFSMTPSGTIGEEGTTNTSITIDTVPEYYTVIYIMKVS